MVIEILQLLALLAILAGVLRREPPTVNPPAVDVRPPAVDLSPLVAAMGRVELAVRESVTHAHATPQGDDFAAPTGVTIIKILRKHEGGWVEIGRRPVGHPDINEALQTPGLAIERDGEFDGGVQHG